MPIDPIKFPNLTAALAVQARYLGDDSSSSADGSNSSDDDSKKKAGKKGICSGNWARLPVPFIRMKSN
jgi:hypothetical protein